MLSFDTFFKPTKIKINKVPQIASAQIVKITRPNKILDMLCACYDYDGSPNQQAAACLK